MFRVRKANERGHADHGWLSTFHTFSFSNFEDLKSMRFRSLRILRGTVSLGGTVLGTSDEVAVSDERSLIIHASTDAEIMLFDLA